MTKTALKPLTLLLSGLLVLSACSQTASIQQGDDAEIIGDNLHKVDNSGVSSAYVDPDVDFSQYRKVAIMPLDTHQLEVIQPSQSRGYNKWELTDKDRSLLAERYMAQMRQYLSEDAVGQPYELVDQPGEGVLVISAAIVTIAPSAPRDDISSRGYSGRSKVFSEGAGSMTIAMAVQDGQSSKELVKLIDKREGWRGMRRNNSVTNLSDVNHMFSIWARKLKVGLDELSKPAAQ